MDKQHLSLKKKYNIFYFIEILTKIKRLIVINNLKIIFFFFILSNIIIYSINIFTATYTYI